uniref:GB1/RHD3-type G domain-containing protein n=1 Tax=Ditylenchus dipsaci TaxID=166011 RepID=A0A915DDZ6_9BILA
MAYEYQTISDNVFALLSAQFLYNEAMIEACDGDYLPDGDLEMAHGRCKEKAVEIFYSTEKAIDEVHSIRFLQMLDDLISASFDVFVCANDFKQGKMGEHVVQTPTMVESAKMFYFDSVKKIRAVVMPGNIQEIPNSSSEEQRVEHPKAVFPSSPGPVQIIEPVEEDHTFKLNVDFLEKILLDPKVADKKVSVIGVAGDFRKGKSFLLNFFLRYLKHQSRINSDSSEDNWLEAESSLLGFSWRGGAERDTKEIAVLLMDTQGAFDSQSTVKDCATIFALSTMISSLQIYNLSHNIQEDDLQHLHLFTEYGLLALEENVNSKPFQSLLFVVRWQRILEKRLMINERQHPELQRLRRHIRESFDDIQCYLMPHPGLDVATSPRFMGELKNINEEFQQHLRTLVPRLLDANNVVVKCINGQPVTCRELVVYFKAYTEIFHGEDLPEPKSMLSATRRLIILQLLLVPKRSILSRWKRSVEEMLHTCLLLI